MDHDLPMKAGPLVSVIIPTFKGEAFLDSAIRSVLSQTYQNIEVIVVDDGSPTDEARVICAAYGERLTYIRQAHSGAGVSRNTGIRASRGDVVAFNDHDDLWAPDKLEKQMALLAELQAAGTQVGLIYTGIQCISESNEPIFKILYKSAGNNYKKMCFIDFVGPPCSVIVTRQALDDAGLFDRNIQGPQDYDLWLRIAEKYEVYSVNEFLTSYRMSAGQLSKNPGIMADGYSQILRKILHAGTLDRWLREKLVACFKKSRALWWKNSAYDFLFRRGDGVMFRKHILEGMSIDGALFGWKVRLYYGLSIVCPYAFKWFGKLKYSKKADIIQNLDVLRPDSLYV